MVCDNGSISSQNIEKEFIRLQDLNNFQIIQYNSGSTNFEPIINVGCDDSILRVVLLVDGDMDVNMMAFLAMRYIVLEIEISLFINLIMVNKKICKPQDMKCNVCFKDVNFHMILEEDDSLPMILNCP